MKRKRKLDIENYGGFILGFEPARTETIEEYIATGYPVSESFSSRDWNLQDREFVFLASQGAQINLFAAVILKKTGARGGGTKRVNLRSIDILHMDPPISASEASCPEALEASVSMADDVRRFEPKNWRILNDLIRRLRPHLAERLDELNTLRTSIRGAVPRDQHTTRLSEERDAVGLALDIAGVDRKKIFRSVKRIETERATSILDIIDAQPIAERSIIESDCAALQLALSGEMASARFKDERQREVRIYVLDSTPLETATGVDLLLYQHQYRSFLLVQYKAMEYNQTEKTWTYRVTGSNVEVQLNAMERVRTMLPRSDPLKLSDLRLCEDPFFFKFCERRALDPSDEGLSAGLTMTASSLQHFLGLPEARTGQSLHVGYENCPRYLNNTEFVYLAKAGWLGSQGAATDAIAQILAAREQGRIGILAVIAGLEITALNRR
ncbi:MAG: hypothetical protein O9337_19415 [Acidovorax sp.]|uniref:hypothetical protein n=1 Tax=Acidovorax sp. TaxID=1872122 RepID=UPI0022BEE83D|nr:hypothetical protein [Acidovorax sp.]MCZ8221596.1 hypothetical protein [Acidovorax sp.]